MIAMLALCAGCGSRLFLDRPIVWFERDDRPIPKPRPDQDSVNRASLDVVVFWPLDRALPRAR